MLLRVRHQIAGLVIVNLMFDLENQAWGFLGQLKHHSFARKYPSLVYFIGEHVVSSCLC